MALQRLIQGGTLLALMVSTGCAPQDSRSTGLRLRESPEAVVAAFFDAMKRGETEGALKHLAGFHSAPEEERAQWYDNMDNIDPEAWDYRIIESMIVVDVALVVFQDDPHDEDLIIDLDPALLILDSGRWQLLPDITSYDWSGVYLTHLQVARLDTLLMWFEQQKPKLKQQVREGLRQ